MKVIPKWFTTALVLAWLTVALPAFGQTLDTAAIDSLNTADMELTEASVISIDNLQLLVFEIKVRGNAGRTVPAKRGQLDGVPVLGYVLPTTLNSEDVGYNAVEGIVALAVTSHPDFDDTPLWDENNDRDTNNDGVVFHSHWVVLVKDTRVPGGLSVRTLDKTNPTVRVPATHPDMPIYLDSPGFAVVLIKDSLKVLVPAQRVNFKTDFRFDAVSAYMEVDTSGKGPMLGVYRVYHVKSGDLSLPFRVRPE